MAKNGLIAFLLLVATALAVVLGMVLNEPGTSTLEIDRDRASIQSEIEFAEAESGRYSGGLVKALIDLRIAVLRNSSAMLDQKRAALIRRVSLNYSIEGHSIKEASDQELEGILKDLAQAETKAGNSKAEAERYSGGLLQSMALVKAATDDLAVSQLRLKFYTSKYGTSLPVPELSTKVPENVPPGRVVKDREAL
ncbi:hypothetical protein LPW26_24245 [Rhodopseudomonas sp. HC1]|uniref:hypothetical protein n=1 Tax=Rhodopseudomonas infernalis TaxID=2897386 RepID=UPI001EE90ECB|nr:hypothetical protein [Rhodopseudomonas infernalis]MCG6207771.1 hypothetical protein [Rhodopseudomonas infernalis]